MERKQGGPADPRQEGDLPGAAAARALEALLPPLRFAVKDGFAGAPRLTGFGETVRGAVARARAAGAGDSPALRRLELEAEGFDALPLAARRKALARIAADVAALIPVPEELRALARAARVEAEARPGGTPPPAAQAASPAPPQPRAAPPRPRAAQGSVARPGRQAAPPPAASAPPPVDAPAPRVPLAPDPPWHALPEARTPEERAARRRRLATRLADLPRVHPAPRALLEERGRETVEAALELWPRAYQDRTALRRISELRVGDEAAVLGTVSHVRVQRMRSGKPLLKVGVQEGGSALELVFFNPPPWRLKQFAAGESLLCSGKVTEGFGARRQMSQPEVEKVQAGDSANFGRIVPVYPGPADYQHPALRKLMKRLVDELVPAAVDDVPAEIRARRGLVGRAEALREAHFPPAGTDPLHAAERVTPAFRRLVFEELFFLQLALAMRRRGVRAEAGIAFDASPAALARAVEPLPFRLTGAQERALAEIARDMADAEPMNRLLQGDVGSGKTAVAFAAMMLAVQSGWQAALMVPTEILAEQHARTLSRWLEGRGVEVALVGASARGKGQREARAAVAEGRARIAVGTHALLEQAVGFERLGLVVVDEQHRFGVMQRASLISKGRRPDVLVMTATPIPRTLALAFYGDLDQSKISELPPGRTPVTTRLFGDSQRKAAYALARGELEAGRQVYVVYPLVEESEKTDLADATTGAADLGKVFPGHEIGLLHGRMKPEEKQRVMDRFRAGEVHVLVATTVIEVGVDVPNASVMIVEHAERFGLSQLHQLRGRVGRGAAKSHCLLLAHFRRAGDDARERLRAMEETQDGFEIARVDLRIRGPGELLGTRQSGQKLLDVADLYRDEAILEEAREEAFGLVERDGDLARPEHAAAREALAGRWAGRLSLAQVG
ncbi:ATP-dependent DNA helicase RecG [Anaeromyxobacter dehalogenans 2CP-1]|uniref:ATP-dependent DNA helicase RecG n=1 Tax=Anaeromyxobacter dehalogenans (strain ATCC BAA-258 / DSM 21875 / 2CP-1) TaxID=455488 RepID=B8J9E2_ANAD2|nr:ATP-dependent DNA helicase RecG [Anaeromyxobacter dehalogenans]ACL65548.1 ATP-dependent DNA helicase RecG [Anaeromyxobacter dehalogenans 2CP-1]